MFRAILSRFKSQAKPPSVGILVLLTLSLAFFSSMTVMAARLPGCDPSAMENQSMKGIEWKSKCLNGSVNAVWDNACDEMSLAQAKRTSSQNGCWKLFSRVEYAKQK